MRKIVGGITFGPLLLSGLAILGAICLAIAVS